MRQMVPQRQATKAVCHGDPVRALVERDGQVDLPRSRFKVGANPIELLHLHCATPLLRLWPGLPLARPDVIQAGHDQQPDRVVGRVHRFVVVRSEGRDRHLVGLHLCNHFFADHQAEVFV